jgi:hypothetical protein
MCRNIKTLFNFEPPVTEEEIRAAALQFVRRSPGLRNRQKQTRLHSFTRWTKYPESPAIFWIHSRQMRRQKTGWKRRRRRALEPLRDSQPKKQ